MSIFEKSLDAMDDYFDNVTAEDMMDSYLEVEKNIGVSVTEYLNTVNKIELIRGNCLVEMDSMGENSVDVVITSPPYNRTRNDKYEYYDDIKYDYFNMIKKSIDLSLKVSSGYVFFNIQQTSYNRIDVHKIIGHFSEYIVDNIIWNKSNPMPGRNIINSYEYILVLSKNKKSLIPNKTYTFNSLTTTVYSKNPYKHIHRAVMNPEVVKYIIHNFTSKSDIILDPFMGVGTTGHEAILNGNGFIGIELSSKYFDVASNRLNDININTNTLMEYVNVDK